MDQPRVHPRLEVPHEVSEHHMRMTDEEILAAARKVNDTEEQAQLVLASLRGRAGAVDPIVGSGDGRRW